MLADKWLIHPESLNFESPPYEPSFKAAAPLISHPQPVKRSQSNSALVSSEHGMTSLCNNHSRGTGKRVEARASMNSCW